MNNNPEYQKSIINNLADSDRIKQQILILGPERISNFNYDLSIINNFIKIKSLTSKQFLTDILNTFIPGQKYSKKYIKGKLEEIYKSSDYQKTSKATDLEEWFEIKECKITADGKREAGFEIIKKK